MSKVKPHEVRAFLPWIASPAIERGADLSLCGRYRWALTRRWGDGRAVCWVMLNPSTADAERDDPTVREVVRFSRLWGYGGAVIVNLYPFRSSSPAGCRRWADGIDLDQEFADAMARNTSAILTEKRSAGLIVAAWGTHSWAQPRADYAVRCLLFGETVHCLGVNADGSPKHPLARGRHRVPRDQEPILYRERGRQLSEVPEGTGVRP